MEVMARQVTPKEYSDVAHSPQVGCHQHLPEELRPRQTPSPQVVRPGVSAGGAVPQRRPSLDVGLEARPSLEGRRGSDAIHLDQARPSLEARLPSRDVPHVPPHSPPRASLESMGFSSPTFVSGGGGGRSSHGCSGGAGVSTGGSAHASSRRPTEDGVSPQRSHPSPPGPAIFPQAPAAISEEDLQYLRRNAENLRREKHRALEQAKRNEARNGELEQRLQQYKQLYEQSQTDSMCRGGGEMEIESLHQQLCAIMMLKDALNTENLELRRRLDGREAAKDEEQGATCVICMDNLINLVCLPCRHLAMCDMCGNSKEVTACPICRTEIKDRMQVYTPLVGSLS